MAPYFRDAFGNPSSRTHAFGWQADLAVQKSRETVAQCLNTRPENVVFTSGATEANNLALIGVLGHLDQPCNFITSATEHKAILEVAEQLEAKGIEITVLPVNKFGQVTPDSLRQALRPHTRLVSIMWANNEIGTLNNIYELAEITRANGSFFHTDGVQAVGRVPIDIENSKIDMLSFSGHKIYGPKGVGALYVNRKTVPIKPIMFGGTQEWGLRPGTHNVPGIVGLAEALKISIQEMPMESKRLSFLRDHMVKTLQENIPNLELNGHPYERLPGNVSLTFTNLLSDFFSTGLPGIACSSGSACSSADVHPSHVLKAIGISPRLAKATVRMGLGRFTTEKHVQSAIDRLLELDRKNRQELALTRQ